VAFAANVSALDAGGNTTCALDIDGGVYCWGSNQFGQLGDPLLRGACDAGTVCSPAAVAVDLGDIPVVSLSVGSRHACAVAAQGEAFCWGDSSEGRLGAESVNGTGPAAPHRVDEPE
jgi:alpha-tubulin suppressor-like RCC1 family protein